MTTDRTVRILGIAGSLRMGSYNRMALAAARELAPPGTEFETAEIRDLPHYDQDLEIQLPEPVTRFKEAVGRADAVLFVSPEYNYSIPGVLKNAIDWGTRPSGANAWAGRTAAIMGASPSARGTVRMQLHLRQVLLGIGMQAVIKPEVMISEAARRFDAEGRLTDEQTRALVGKLLESLAGLTRQLRS